MESWPDGAGAGEKAGGVIENSEEMELVQGRFEIPARLKAAGSKRRTGNLGEGILQLGMAEPVARANGPFVAEKLIESGEQRAFLKVEVLARATGREGRRGDG